MGESINDEYQMMTATNALRFVKRSPIEASQRERLILQQWWWDGSRGEWRDVPVEIEDGKTK